MSRKIQMKTWSNEVTAIADGQGLSEQITALKADWNSNIPPGINSLIDLADRWHANNPKLEGEAAENAYTEMMRQGLSESKRVTTASSRKKTLSNYSKIWRNRAVVPALSNTLEALAKDNPGIKQHRGNDITKCLTAVQDDGIDPASKTAIAAVMKWTKTELAKVAKSKQARADRSKNIRDAKDKLDKNDVQGRVCVDFRARFEGSEWDQTTVEAACEMVMKITSTDAAKGAEGAAKAIADTRANGSAEVTQASNAGATPPVDLESLLRSCPASQNVGLTAR
jgi:hypothetical protein